MLEQTAQMRKAQLDKLQAENDMINSQMKNNEIKMVELGSKLVIGQEALQFLEDVANSRRGAMKTQIENVVTEALRMIYGDEYRIELSYNVKNNRSFMDIELIRKTPKGDVRRQMDGFGGGVSDTISVPLRLLVMLGSQQTEKICILDECYKHMDLERIDRVAEFLKEIATRLGMQIIMCSHHEALKQAADSVWTIEDVEGRAEIKKV